jgi:hypothetical protein
VNTQKDRQLTKQESRFGPFVSRLKLIREIRELAFRGLQKMFCSEERMFIYQLIRSGDRLVSQGLSHRYTAVLVASLCSRGSEEIG